MNITFQGNPIALNGSPVQAGDHLPEFQLRATDLSDKTTSDFSGVTVFLVVPSLDTPVCDLEVRRFHEEIERLGNAKVYAVSMDLPFAQERWCGAHGVHGIQTLSDYVDHSFGKATGTLIDGLELLTRAVIVVGSDGIVSYVQFVPEVTDQPDFNAVYEAVANTK